MVCGMAHGDRAQALIEDLFGRSDAAADRAVRVLHAQAAALAWIHETTGQYPAPAYVAARLNTVAQRLRDGADDADPATVLAHTAAQALVAHRRAAAA